VVKLGQTQQARRPDAYVKDPGNLVNSEEQIWTAVISPTRCEPSRSAHAKLSMILIIGLLMIHIEIISRWGDEEGYQLDTSTSFMRPAKLKKCP
jgi:hypothetical protein